MAGLIILGTMAALSAFAMVASRWGVDSRDGFSDPRRSEYPIGMR